MAAYRITPADCFGVQRTVDGRTARGSSALHFRNHGGGGGDEQHVPLEDLPTAERRGFASSSSSTTSSADRSASLPTWLNHDHSDRAEQNMGALQRHMRDSFFTENETLKLRKAIEEAAAGDRNKAAGAAEFCLLLSETMEMGLSALAAAAFHYCYCVAARERAAAAGLPAGFNFPMALLPDPARLQPYGHHVVDIATDAARLKQLEVLAAAVMRSAEDSARVSPDGRDAENLRHLLLTETKDWRALAIRSAACLYRLRGILDAEQPELTPESVRVAREALHIYAPTASRLGMHRLKNELEGAAFRILYRRQYHAVRSLHRRRPGGDAAAANEHDQLDESMRQVLEQVREDMTAMLEGDEEFQREVESFTVTARVKEPYSMWRKMLRLGYEHVLQVPDALALRVVLTARKLSPAEPDEVTRARERRLCYYAQTLCMQRWKPAADPRFKDYMADPKRNGYQSLHYTANTWWQGDQWTVEVQVRSAEMHQVAEFGLASHWDYKAQQQQSSQEEESSSDSPMPDAYLRNIQEWHGQQQAAVSKSDWDASPASFEPVWLSDIWQSKARADRIRARTQRLEPYLQALTAAQSDLVRERVFVFLTPSSTAAEGKVLALPAGACVLDALREGERVLGRPLSDQWLTLNGSPTTKLTHRLQNGDVLTVPMTSPAVSVTA
jgi:ppGpp synthetase/RelA/SpoT-type nucleotidyltranferase